MVIPCGRALFLSCGPVSSLCGSDAIGPDGPGNLDVVFQIASPNNSEDRITFISVRLIAHSIKYSRHIPLSRLGVNFDI
jgi:hypothetical protein